MMLAFEFGFARKMSGNLAQQLSTIEQFTTE